MTRHLKHRHIRRITEYYYHRITATVDGSLPDQDSDQLETPKSIFLFFVFQAKCVETGESVAIKVVLQEKHVCMLDHPNVVHLFLCLLLCRETAKVLQQVDKKFILIVASTPAYQGKYSPPDCYHEKLLLHIQLYQLFWQFNQDNLYRLHA
uniref:Uncharacterized protein n=1 Tax=Solanum lycopersicum TaxID=4081 RepID=A0A3Q7F944_SOLLC